jgi:hypothetical protein
MASNKKPNEQQKPAVYPCDPRNLWTNLPPKDESKVKAGRKAGGTQQEYLTVRKAGGSQQEY